MFLPLVLVYAQVAGADVKKKELCEPGKSYQVSLDKKTNEPSVRDLGISDGRFSKGVVWYQDPETKKHMPIPCTVSMNAAIQEAVWKATEDKAELKDLIEAQKKGKVIDIPSSFGWTAKDLITSPESPEDWDARPVRGDASNGASTRAENTAQRELERMLSTSPEGELAPEPAPWANQDPNLYLAQKKLESQERVQKFYDDLKDFVVFPKKDSFEDRWDALGSQFRPDFDETFSDVTNAPKGNFSEDALKAYGTPRDIETPPLPTRGMDVTKDLLSNCDPLSAGFSACSLNYARAVMEAAKSPLRIRTPQPPAAQKPRATTPDAYTAFKNSVFGPLVDPTIKAWSWVKSWFQ